MASEKVANVAWTKEDVMTVFDCTPDEAWDLLCKHQSTIEDAMVRVGWEVIEIAGLGEGLPMKEEQG